jgi:peptidoglycan/LPS O-acetylase OafA/YrhL
MLVNKLGFENMEFGKKVKLRIWFSAVLIVLGALTVGAIFYYGLIGADFSSGFYFGLGFGLICAGIATIIKNMIYLKNAEKFKAAEIAYKDERNRYISNKTWSVSALIMLFLIYLAVVIAGSYNMMVFFTLLAVLGVFGLVLLIVQTVLKKIY